MKKRKRRFRIEYIKHGRGNWSAVFWIDHQGFTFVNERTKREVKWFGKNLRTAISKLEFKKISNEKQL